MPSETARQVLGAVLMLATWAMSPATGAVIAVQLVQSSGSRLLDEATLAAARASRFAPATRGQVRVSSEALATYRFELR